MLCGIRSSNNCKVFASMSEKTDGPFYCSGCQQELILRKGRIKVHHFAHKPPYTCTRGKGESEVHRKCKEIIYNQLSHYQHVTDLDVEVDFNSVIADIYCKINGIPVAIEIQRSNLSVNDITSRTQEYENLGIHVLWLALFTDKLKDKKYSPKAWEKWCHAAYFGRVYYWLNDLTVVPVHFSEYKDYVEVSHWYDSYGQEQSAGGYFKSSKRYKSISMGKHLNIATDFHPTSKSSWRGGSIYIPTCKIYSSKQQKWW